MDAKFRSRKFILATMALSAGIFALFFGLMTGSEFIGLTVVVLALYGAANVTESIKKP